MAHQIVYMKYVDKSGKASYVEHICWDAKRFIEASKERMKDEGGLALSISKDEFLKQKGNKS